ncbi:MAG: hypothetical protein ACUVT0_08445 [Thermochromatium sp.]
MTTSAKSQGSLMLALFPLFILYAGTVALFALTRENASGIALYWGYFVPVIGLISLITAWGNAYVRGDSRLFYLIKQLIIWGAFIWILSLLHRLGIDSALGGQKAAVTLVMMTALVALLVGFQLDIKMVLYGVFLGFCGYLLADPKHSAILVKIGEPFKVVDPANKPVTMVIALAIAAFLVAAFFMLSTRGSVAAKRSS